MSRFSIAVAQPDETGTDDEREVIYVYGTGPSAGIGELDGDRAEHRDAKRALDESVFVTVVHVDERAGETVAVADVLAESVGVNTRSLGGLGAFSSVSIRGASPTHTAVSVDGIPLSRFTTQGADLGAFELFGFSELEVYRGGVPVRLGGAAMGGAVNFVTGLGRAPDGRRFTVSTGVGSFDARHVRARYGDTLLDGALDMHASLGYRGARGDYEFFSDNGTPLNLDDDGYTLRSNNSFGHGDMVLRLRWNHKGITVEGGSRTSHKAQGVPGRDTVQTQEASLATWNQLVDVRVERAAARTALMGSVFAMFEQHEFVDMLGEVGLGVEDHRYRTSVLGTTNTLTRAFQSTHIATVGVEGRLERFTDVDRLDEDAPRIQGQRLSAAVTAADKISLLGRRLSFEPGLRVDAMHTDPGQGWDPVLVDPATLGSRSDVFVSPRLSARAGPSDALVFKGSVGRYFRAPTLLELFGDRGFLVGDPTLAPETGSNADLGLVLAPARAFGPMASFDRLYLEAAVFASRPRDAIAFVPSAGRVAVARNIGDATLHGVEATATVRLFRRATVAANYTLVDSEQHHMTPSFDGKRLPGRPRHQVYARLDLAQRITGELAVVWADLSYTSGNFLDQANTNEIPSRYFLGLGAKVSLRAGLLMALEIKNLTDERVEPLELANPPTPELARIPRAVSDVLGYPLPGRSFYARIDWRF